MFKLVNGDLSITIVDFEPVYEILSYGTKSDGSAAGFSFHLTEVTETNYPFTVNKRGDSELKFERTSIYCYFKSERI